LKKPMLRILTPSIGDWSRADLRKWCSAVGIQPENIQVIWPDAKHDWVSAPNGTDEGLWKMPRKSLDELEASKINLVSMPHKIDGKVFVSDVTEGNRWAHTKFYEFNEGLLLGSHNWSKSAWGLPSSSSPKNFELSVFVEKAHIPLLKKLSVLQKVDVPIMDNKKTEDDNYWLRWACATWDGNELLFEYRLSKGTIVQAFWLYGSTWTQFSPPKIEGSVWKSTSHCNNTEPIIVRLTRTNPNGTEDISVTDIRPGNVVPIGTDIGLKHMADLILLESYGGPPAETDPIHRSNKVKKPNGDQWDGGIPANYQSSWLISTRRWTSIVDRWLCKWKEAPNERTLNEARRLADALERIANNAENHDVGASIAAEELRIIIGGACL